MSRRTIKPLIQFLENQEIDHLIRGYYQKFSTSPEEWIEMARKDIKKNDKRGRANALGNAKRAVESRIDNLIWGYGLSHFSKKENWNFPRKLDVLIELDILAPRLLKKLITSPRNFLEHEYEVPESNDEVIDTLDLAELYILGTGQACQVPIAICGPKEGSESKLSSLNICNNSLDFAVVLQPSQKIIYKIIKAKTYTYKISDSSYQNIIKFQKVIRDKDIHNVMSLRDSEKSSEEFILKQIKNQIKK